MTQAKGHIGHDSVKTSFTRRAALVGAACLAAPASAAAVCVAPAEPDAELIEAARRYVPLLAIEHEARAKVGVCSDAAREMCQHLEGDALMVALEHAADVTGWDREHDKLDAIWDQMNPIEGATGCGAADVGRAARPCTHGAAVQ